MNKLFATLITSAVIISAIGVIPAGATNTAQAAGIGNFSIGFRLSNIELSTINVGKVNKPVWERPTQFTPMVDPEREIITSGPVRVEQGQIVLRGLLQAA